MWSSLLHRRAPTLSLSSHSSTRTLRIAALWAVLLFQTAPAQQSGPRSGDYLFASSGDDVRALWVNPAGLGVLVEASVMAEAVVERPVDGDLRLREWAVGFNSRGLSMGYLRERSAPGQATYVLRLGTGTRFRGGAVGAALSFLGGGGTSTQRGLDVGVRLHPLPPVDLGAAVHNIGRPLVLFERRPVTGVVALTWTPLDARGQISIQSRFAERLNMSGYDVTHRAGARLATRGSLPLGALLVVDLASKLKIDGWTVGIVLGGRDQAVLLGSAVRTEGASRFDVFSMAGVASTRPPGRQF